jgi:flavodoxin I
MKVLVVYDSLYGNTEKIARTIAGAVSPTSTVEMLRAGKTEPAKLKDLDVLFVGSPTQGGRATRPIQDFLTGIQADALKGVRAASFDTRIKNKLVKVFGYAAGRIEKTLGDKGATVVSPAGMFFVKSTRGPLDDGEEERAAAWAADVIEGK